jgi:carboxymethylenebutenolidase
MENTPPNGHLHGQGAGLLVLHAWWGLTPFFKDLCQRLAAEGFVAFAPDLYHGKTAPTIEEAEKLRSKLKRKQAVADVITAAEYLRRLDVVTGEGLGVIGFSLGASYALGLSVERPDAIRAVVVFYGTRGGDYSPARAAYLGHFAKTDAWVAASGVKKLEKSLRAAQRPVTFFEYAGTGHWFFEADRPDAYHARAADLAWQRTVEFLRSVLTPAVATDDTAVDLDELIDQLTTIEAQTSHSALAYHIPRGEHEQFFNRLCRSYLTASPEQRDLIRTAVSDKPGVRNNLLGYIHASARHIYSPADRHWLRIGLAAACIENCSFDYRDFLVALKELFVAAGRATLDARREFQAASEWSSQDKPRGGSTPVSRMLAEFHTYAVVGGARRR